MIFENKLGHANLTLERIYLYITDLIRNHWQHMQITFKFRSCPNFMEEYPDLSPDKSLLIGLQSVLMVTHFLFGLNFSILFSL